MKHQRARPKTTPSVVYLAYGSNIDIDRLTAYLAGSRRSSEYGVQQGSADRAPPTVLGSTWIPGQLRFGGVSRRWNGGVALADLRATRSRLFVVRYEISWQQLVDLVAQENRLDSVRMNRAALLRTGRQKVSRRLYDLVVSPSETGRHSEFLLTTSGRIQPNSPPARYLEVLQRGLARWIGEAAAAQYLDEAARAGTAASR